jgi:hypothetical protein
MHGEHGETMVRRIQGVLSLAKKYGALSVETAASHESRGREGYRIHVGKASEHGDNIEPAAPQVFRRPPDAEAVANTALIHAFNPAS